MPPASRWSCRHSARRRAPDALPVDRRGLREVTNQRIGLIVRQESGRRRATRSPGIAFTNQGQIALGVDKTT